VPGPWRAAATTTHAGGRTERHTGPWGHAAALPRAGWLAAAASWHAAAALRARGQGSGDGEEQAQVIGLLVWVAAPAGAKPRRQEEKVERETLTRRTTAGLRADSGEAASRRSGEQLNDGSSGTPGGVVTVTGGVGACEGKGEGNGRLGLQNRRAWTVFGEEHARKAAAGRITHTRTCASCGWGTVRGLGWRWAARSSRSPAGRRRGRGWAAAG
jgi:hypothetical protein